MKNWNSKDIVEQFRKALELQANPVQALRMEAYMKNNWAYYGVNSPSVKLILKSTLSYYSKPTREQLRETMELLWDDSHRECQYLAQFTSKKYLKCLVADDIPWIVTLISNKSWWDTVDYLASTMVGHCLKGDATNMYRYVDQWIKSDLMWLRRTAILCQLKYKNDTDFDLLKSLIIDVYEEKEFFIRKAAGWALREYSKVRPDLVSVFINESEGLLSNLTVKEASKYLHRT